MNVVVPFLLLLVNVVVPFLLLLVVFDVAESQRVSKKVICGKKDELTLKILKGRDGARGPLGFKGERGLIGDNGLPGPPGENGVQGVPGLQGMNGDWGYWGTIGETGLSGEPGQRGLKGMKGIVGEIGAPGEQGVCGVHGLKGEKGEPGLPGLSNKIKEDIVKALLNDYYVAQSGYHNRLYHVTSHDLTDGRTDTGGWGSESAKEGNYIQASYIRPVYVSSVTVAGGFIPSWNKDVQRGPEYGFIDLESSSDGKTWKKIAKILSPVKKEMMTHQLTVPITAQYWRLISTEDKWVGTTEFALKPLVKSKSSSESGSGD